MLASEMSQAGGLPGKYTDTLMAVAALKFCSGAELRLCCGHASLAPDDDQKMRPRGGSVVQVLKAAT
jgi:hypothetical protein